MLKILAHYNTITNEENRNIPPAACNKLDYIISVLSEAEEKIEIISASNTRNKKSSPKTVKKIKDNVNLTLLKGFARGSWIKNKVSTLFFSIQLFFYLLFHLKKQDTLLVYHSLSLISKVKILKKIKKFKLILEVEEIYGDVIGNKKIVKKELKYFEKADGYIFPTELLNEKVNKKNKPYVIVHGSYYVEDLLTKKFNDNRIHCVYAGTFDPRKGGVAAAAAAEYLNENYHVHILGFGTDSDKKLLLSEIERVSSVSKCRITFDGLLSGVEYIQFIQKCHIGLSTQNPNAAFNDTSFPSKVLSYLANGLRVVSVKIKALETSKVNDLLYYYENSTPKDLADSIMAIDVFSPYNSREKIGELDREFGELLSSLLKKIKE